MQTKIKKSLAPLSALTVAGLLSLLLTACGGSSSSFKVGGDASPEFSPGASNPAGDVTAYDGRWTTSPACIYDAFRSEAFQYQWEIQGNSAVLTSDVFDTSDCSGQAVSVEFLYQFQYGSQRPQVSSVCRDVREVDMVLIAVQRDGQSVPLSQLAADISLYQYNLICTTGDKLYFGDTSSDPFFNGVTPRRRPISLDEERPYLRD